MRNVIVTAAVAVAVIVGAGLGYGVGAATVEPEVRTVEKRVDRTPAACNEALTQADAILESYGEFAGIASRILGAAGDTLGSGGVVDKSAVIESEQQKIQGLNQQFDTIGPAYSAARDKCLVSP